MRILIDEYGKIILSVIVGSVILGIVVVGIRVWYQDYYPSLQQDSGVVLISSEDTPVLLVDKIEIEVKDTREEVDFASYAQAYDDITLEMVIPVEVYGVETVDVTTQGIYQLTYVATSSVGSVFSKNVPVLIY